jgi:hypothetical protein
MVANPEASADCKGHWIRVDVGSNGGYVVTNGRNEFSKAYKRR